MRYIDDAIVPPFLNLLSFFPDKSLIKLLLELPTSKGKPREWKIEILRIKLILCFKFFPKPMPGSRMILLCLIPFDLNNFIFFSKKSYMSSN